MKQRGRKSAEALSSITAPPRTTQLQPPPSLNADERKIFQGLVAAVAIDHFRPSDLPLLVCYVQSIDLSERAAKELRKGPVLNGKASPWILIQEKEVRAMTALSMRLRLSPQARHDPKKLARQKLEQGPKPWNIHGDNTDDEDRDDA
jgi:phage terminase small subunit